VPFFWTPRISVCAKLCAGKMHRQIAVAQVGRDAFVALARYLVLKTCRPQCCAQYTPPTRLNSTVAQRVGGVYLDTRIKRLLQLRFGFDATTTKNEHVHFFVASRGVVSNKKAVVEGYNNVIVYVTVIRMAFTLTDQHRVASFNFVNVGIALSHRPPTSEVKCRLV